MKIQRSWLAAEKARELGRSGIATLPATSMEAAAVQMRVLHSCGYDDREDALNRRVRMHHSILNVIENNGGGSRDQWAGEHYINKSTDPFRYEIS